ncbi:MAG: hypothetical protein JO149_09445 [Gammaproteobacteria bacterium]|nr:hypothetical protein [Gammaproteobacteria bacterium]
MKAAILTIMGSCLILLNSNAIAGSCGSNGGCGGGGCNPQETSCQCTDPACNSPWDSDCISRAYCCKAFGNVGGR